MGGCSRPCASHDKQYGAPSRMSCLDVSTVGSGEPVAGWLGKNLGANQTLALAPGCTGCFTVPLSIHAEPIASPHYTKCSAVVYMLRRASRHRTAEARCWCGTQRYPLTIASNTCMLCSGCGTRLLHTTLRCARFPQMQYSIARPGTAQHGTVRHRCKPERESVLWSTTRTFKSCACRSASVVSQVPARISPGAWR